jgi:hypothetical protein
VRTERPKRAAHEGKQGDNTAVPEHGIKVYRGVEVQLHSFTVSALDGGERSASLHGRFARGNNDVGSQ